MKRFLTVLATSAGLALAGCGGGSPAGTAGGPAKAATGINQPAAPVGTTGPPQRVLGLQIGEALKVVKSCPDSMTKAPAEPCWLTGPNKYTGVTTGWIKLPDTGDRPSWAANPIFDVEIKAGRLERFTVRSVLADPADIIQSIAARFGRPALIPGTTGIAASWQAGGLHILMHCEGRDDQCRTLFEPLDPWRKHLEEQAAEDRRRPLAP